VRVSNVRVFLETNVLVSAFLARGLCADLLRLVLREVLSRKGKLPPAQIEAIETFLRGQPIAPWPEQTLRLGLVDADDEWVLTSALLAEADLVVSGDRGVLACTTCPLPLLTPRACWQHLHAMIHRSLVLAIRTTLEIDDYGLATAKDWARRQGVSAGKVVLRLLRSAL
jgi:predicted nucleic acid-binding protein